MTNIQITRIQPRRKTFIDPRVMNGIKSLKKGESMSVDEVKIDELVAILKKLGNKYQLKIGHCQCLLYKKMFPALNATPFLYQIHTQEYHDAKGNSWYIMDQWLNQDATVSIEVIRHKNFIQAPKKLF